MTALVLGRPKPRLDSDGALAGMSQPGVVGLTFHTGALVHRPFSRLCRVLVAVVH